MHARFARSLAEVAAAEWNALPGAEAPFLRHEFLFALESSGCATGQTGWDACHVLLRTDDGRLAGAMPLYLKSHSWGEFVFDFAWAEAYRRAGLPYYPRLVSAVPFTPATGPRLLADSAQTRAALLAAAVIAWNGQSILRPAIAGLMDRSAEPSIRSKVYEIARSVTHVRAVEKVIVRRAGTHYFADLHVQADPEMSLHDAHAVGHHVKAAIMERLPNVRDVLVHMEPYELNR